MEYPDVSLKELGELLNPPVGKSGVNHRLRKLSEIAQGLREQHRQKHLKQMLKSREQIFLLIRVLRIQKLIMKYLKTI